MPRAELQTRQQGPEASAKRPEATRSALQREPGQPSLAGRPGDVLLRLQRSHGNRYVQRILQRSGMGSAGGPVSPEIEGEIERARGTGHALDATARSFLEPSMSADFGNVRVHTGPAAQALNRSLSARAFTTGSDIFFDRGEYQPGSSAGRELLAHELTHVVQQGGAPAVRRKCAECEEEEKEEQQAVEAEGAPALQTKLVVGAVDDPYEREADQVARQVMHAPRAPVISRKCAKCQAEEEEARREVRRTAAPTAAVQRAPRLATVTQPPAAALSVSMEGLYFEPAESGVFEAGPKAPQLLALALNRLLGSQYRPDLVDPVFAFLDRRKQARHGGFLANQTAKAGEPMGRTGLSLQSALLLVDYLEKDLKLTVDLSAEQREVLEKGFATFDAWTFLLHEAELHQKPLPSWYTIELFFMEMGQQGAFLKEYQENIKLIQYNRQIAENVALQTITRLHDALLAPLQAMEAIRTDTSLATNEKTREIYARLWNVTPPGPGGAVAVPTQVAKPFAAGLFLAWLRSQKNVAEQAVTDPARRALLLERYGRFLSQATMKSPASGVQQVRDTPATANRPPIRSTLSVVPDVRAPLYDAALGTDHRFTHQVEFPDVWTALGSYGFAWERVRVPDDKIGQPVDPDTLKGEKATSGEVASVRFGRATRYSKADIERVLDETVADLGPAGVGALTLVGANAILRYAGTGIQLAIDILTTPQGQKQIVFPEPGLYLVRGIMSAYLKGEEEIVRAPSVAYYPVLARDPDEMATAGVARAAKSREAAKARIAEIDDRLQTGLDDKERQALLAERADLERSLGPVGAALEHQQAELTQYVADLAAGRQTGDLDTAKEQLGEIGKILDVRKRRKLPAGESPVAHFVSDLGRSLPLNLEIVDKPKAGQRFHVVVSDLTTHKSGLEDGYGATRDEAILAALQSLLEGTHGYGRGRVAIQLGGVTHTKRIEASVGNLLIESIDNVTLVLSLAAVVAAPLTDGASLALLLPLGVVGAVPSAYRVVQKIEAGTFTFDLENALELVNVVGSVIGIARLGAGSLRLVRVGRGLLIMGYGVDALSGVLLGASVLDQINALQGLPEGERAAALTMLLGQTMLSAGITVGGALAHRAHQARLEARAQGGHPEPLRLPAGAPAPAEPVHPPVAAEPAKPPVPAEPAAKPPETSAQPPTAGEAEEKRPSRDVSTSDAPPQYEPGSLGPESEWKVGTNRVGATVLRSETAITGDAHSPAHLEGLVVWARRTGRPVTIITGYHGTPGGHTTPAPEFAGYDKAYYGQKYPDVTVIDASQMSHNERLALIDSTRGVVIVATCYGACAHPLLLGPGKPPLALPPAGGTSGPPAADFSHLAPVALGPGMETDWILTKNAADALVFKSLTRITSLPAHVEGIVIWAQLHGEKVTFFTGYHGSASGGTYPEKRFAVLDAKYYGKKYPNMEIVDTSEWTHEQRIAAIESTPGVVIASTCYGACAKPSSAPAPAAPPARPARPAIDAPEALPPAGGTSGPPVRVTVEEMFHRYAVEEDLKQLGPVNAETQPLLEKNDALRGALAESPLAAAVLKKCSSLCFPPNATRAQIERLERYLRAIGPGYDEVALRQYLYDRRDLLDSALAGLEQAKTVGRLNGWLAFYNTEGEGGIQRVRPYEDPAYIAEMVRRAHDMGVKYGEIQAKAEGLFDVGFENPIQIGGFDQGFDDVLRRGPNLDTGDVYIVEYKGGDSTLKPGQMEYDWVVRNIRRLYFDDGSTGQDWARVLAKALREGRLKGIAYSTKISAGSPLPTTTIGTWTYRSTKLSF